MIFEQRTLIPRLRRVKTSESPLEQGTNGAMSHQQRDGIIVKSIPERERSRVEEAVGRIRLEIRVDDGYSNIDVLGVIERSVA